MRLIKVLTSAVVSLFFVFNFLVSHAAPNQNPPTGGVFEVNQSAPKPSLRINSGGDIDLGAWKATAIGISYGGTGATQTGDTNCPGPSCVTGARTNIGAAASGANSDITSLSPTGNLILTPTGSVGIGTTSIPSGAKLQIAGIASNKMISFGQYGTNGLTETNFVGTRYSWDTDNLHVGLRDYGADRKDAVFNIEQSGDNFRFQVAGSDILFLSGMGNVGIGTVSPVAKFTVSGGTTNTSGIGLRSGDVWTVFRNYPTTNNSAIDVTSGGTESTIGTTGYNLILNPSGGNVGIGTTGPSSSLDIEKSNAALEIRDRSTVHTQSSSPPSRIVLSSRQNVDGTNAPYVGSSLEFQMDWNGSTLANAARIVGRGHSGWGGALDFDVASGGSATSAYVTRMHIAKNGNVGIGRTDPAQKLDVAGNIAHSGSLISRGPTYSTTWMQFNEHEFGNSLILGAGGLAVLGSGESASQVRANISASDETLYLSSDNAIQFVTNLQTGWVNRIAAMTINTNGTVNMQDGLVQNVATGIADSDAANIGYVKSAVSGGTASNSSACSADLVCEMQGADLQNGNITGVNKITVQTIDPLYEIGGKKYSTYGSDTLGIKVTFYGKGVLKQYGDVFSYVVDIDDSPRESDLWVFWQTIDEGEDMDNLMVNLTPQGGRADLWYDLDPINKQIKIYGDKKTKFSYQLIAPRRDHKKWPTITPEDNDEKGVFLEEKK